MVPVPLYGTLGQEALSHIINQCELQIIVVGEFEKATILLGFAQETPTVKHLILVQSNDQKQLEEIRRQCDERNIQLHQFQDILKSGAENPSDLMPPTPDDTYIICYTSGTTGLPKGVELTHKAIIAEASSFEYLLNDIAGFDLSSRDSLISYLPLAHMFEQTSHVVMHFFGARIGFSSGDIRKLNSEMQVLKPTFLPTVPRLLNRISDKVNTKLAKLNPVARFLFNIAYAARLRDMKNGIYTNDTFLDGLFFNDVRKELGGHVRAVITGSAPISAPTLELCRVMFGCPIFEGYGQTECCGACTVSVPREMEGGHVGAPIPGAHVKLVDVPEMKYFAKDDQGEICYAGPIITKGYFHEPAKTADTIDKDGWLHTGDIGCWLPNGTLKVIDRMKHIFKLAQGEYVAPEKIESIYVRSEIIEQVFVDGNSTERFLVAIAVPHHKEFTRFAGSKGVTGSWEELCANRTLRGLVLEELQRLGKLNKLNSIEQIQALHLHPDSFTVEDNLLTPTLKNKRPELRKRFRQEIDKLYEDARTG